MAEMLEIINHRGVWKSLTRKVKVALHNIRFPTLLTIILLMPYIHLRRVLLQKSSYFLSKFQHLRQTNCSSLIINGAESSRGSAEALYWSREKIERKLRLFSQLWHQCSNSHQAWNLAWKHLQAIFSNRWLPTKQRHSLITGQDGWL